SDLDSRIQCRAPSPLVASSSNFIIRSHPGDPSASELLKTCQQLREQLQATWLGDVSPAPWRPRCEVVVHGSRASYQQAVGRGAGQSYGSSLIKFGSRQVVTRRIDLLPGAGGEVSALAHELTHVVLADHFRGRQPPRWVDEGVATLADASEKRRLHHRDCHYALHSGTAFPLNELFRLERCSSYDQAAAFYGQSLSLVGYLVEHGTPLRFLAFVDLAMERGYDHALREIYNIDGPTDLERRWREYAFAPGNSLDATRLATFTGSDE
ncbi:MAG: hypothetical protein KY475_27820, partial [Planctomycetes bacterium]|nr:hypothetical protein [Planctomycetota bacterium]